jgi:hypothetical protein
MHRSTVPVHRLSLCVTPTSFVPCICQWFVIKIAAAINAAPMTMAIGVPILRTMRLACLNG